MVEIITAITGLIGAVASLLAAIAGLLAAVKGSRTPPAKERRRTKGTARASYHRPSGRLRRRAA